MSIPFAKPKRLFKSWINISSSLQHWLQVAYQKYYSGIKLSELLPSHKLYLSSRLWKPHLHEFFQYKLKNDPKTFCSPYFFKVIFSFYSAMSIIILKFQRNNKILSSVSCNQIFWHTPLSNVASIFQLNLDLTTKT